MAKKEKKASGGITLKPNTVDKYLHGKFGDKIFIDGRSFVQRKNIVIPISPALNQITSGGIPEGSFVVATGPPKVGKTTMCLDFAATAQHKQYAPKECPKGRMVYFFNVEGRIKSRDLLGIKHLDIDDPNKFEMIISTPDRILTAEDNLEILEAYIHTKPGAIFIVDSISQLCSNSRMTSYIGDRYRDDVPLMLASLTKRVGNVLPINKSILMCVTHQYANQNPASKKTWTEASGNKVQYQADVKLRASHCEPFMSDDAQVGQKVHWECGTSALGPPNGKAISLLRYGHGLDKEWELLQYLCDVNLVKLVAGGWHTFNPDTKDEKKVQGGDKAANYLRENPKLFLSLEKEFNEIMGT